MRFTGRQRGKGEYDARRGSAIPLELILADGRSFPIRARFSFADRQVDVRTGTIKVAALFPNPGNLLRPGQFAKVRAIIETKKGALLVPQRAVNELQGRFQVAVVGPDNKVELRRVKVGERVGSLWVIDEGLKPGETIVVEGIQKVKAGMPVTPKPFAGRRRQAGSPASRPRQGREEVTRHGADSSSTARSWPWSSPSSW